MTANGPPDLLARFCAVAGERRGTLFRIAGRVVGADDADDVVQNALLHTFRALDRFQGDDGDLAAWLQTSTHYAAISWVRHQAVVSRFHVDDTMLEAMADPDREPEDAAIRREDEADACAQAAAVLAPLPLRWRQVLWATCAEERTNREAAPLLGLSWAALKTIRYRASERCRELAA